MTDETPLNDKKLLSRNDVAKMLDLAPKTVTDLVKAGKLAPPLKITEKRRGWTHSDIEDFINSLERAEVNEE